MTITEQEDYFSELSTQYPKINFIKSYSQDGNLEIDFSHDNTPAHFKAMIFFLPEISLTFGEEGYHMHSEVYVNVSDQEYQIIDIINFVKMLLNREIYIEYSKEKDPYYEFYNFPAEFATTWY